MRSSISTTRISNILVGTKKILVGLKTLTEEKKGQHKCFVKIGG
jgi:hypothetical protein